MVASRSASTIWCMSSARPITPELGHRLVRADHQLHAWAHAARPGVRRSLGGAPRRWRRPLSTRPGPLRPPGRATMRPEPPQDHRRLTSGGVVIEGTGHRVVAPADDGVLVVADRAGRPSSASTPPGRHRPFANSAAARSSFGNRRLQTCRTAFAVIQAMQRLVKQFLANGQ